MQRKLVSRLSRPKINRQRLCDKVSPTSPFGSSVSPLLHPQKAVTKAPRKRRSVFTSAKKSEHNKNRCKRTRALQQTCLGDLTLGDNKSIQSLLELFERGQLRLPSTSVTTSRTNTVQQKLCGGRASIKSAKYPIVELYERLGLQYVLREEMKTRFREPSVLDLSERRRRQLIKVTTPIVKEVRSCSHLSSPLSFHMLIMPTHGHRYFPL